MPKKKTAPQPASIGKKFAALQMEGPEFLEGLKARLLEGQQVTAIARDMMEAGHFEGMKYEAVIKTMYRFRDHLHEEKIKQIAAQPLAVLDHQTSISALKEFEEIVVLQKGRVLKSLAQEEKTPFINQMTSGEIRLLGEVVDKLARLQMDTGVIKRAPKTIQGQFDVSQSQPFCWSNEKEALASELGTVIEHEIDELLGEDEELVDG